MKPTKEQMKETWDRFEDALNKIWDSLTDEEQNKLDEEMSHDQSEGNLYENYKKIKIKRD
jgi:hypothetical protein